MDKIKAGRKRYREENRDKINQWRRSNYQIIKDDKRERYIESATAMQELKTPCVKCGESRYYVIDFHHIDPTTKKFNVGTAKTYSIQTLTDEVKKCICLCRNCHQEFHYLYGNKPNNPVDSLAEYLGRSPYEI
jgi:hypothetical protein